MSCRHCGTPFEPRGRRRYCSPRCRLDAQNARDRAGRAEARRLDALPAQAPRWNLTARECRAIEARLARDGLRSRPVTPEADARRNGVGYSTSPVWGFKSEHGPDEGATSPSVPPIELDDEARKWLDDHPRWWDDNEDSQ
jgi:hypothetical protein